MTGNKRRKYHFNLRFECSTRMNRESQELVLAEILAISSGKTFIFSSPISKRLL